MKVFSSVSSNGKITYSTNKSISQEEVKKVNEIINEVADAKGVFGGIDTRIISDFLIKQDTNKRNLYLEKLINAVRTGTEKKLNVKYTATHADTKRGFVRIIKYLAEEKVHIPDFCIEYLDELFFGKTRIQDKLVCGIVDPEIIEVLKIIHKTQKIPQKIETKLALSVNDEYLFFDSFITNSLEILKNSSNNLSKEAIEHLNKANHKYAEREAKVFEGPKTRYNRIAILKLLSKKGVFDSNNLHYANTALELYERRSKDPRFIKDDNFDKEKLKLKKLIAKEEPRVNRSREEYKIIELIDKDQSKTSTADIEKLMGSENLIHQRNGIFRLYKNYILTNKDMSESTIRLIDNLGARFITEKDNIGHISSMCLLFVIMKRNYHNPSKEAIEAIIHKANDKTVDLNLLNSIQNGIVTLFINGNFKPATEFLSYKDTASNEIIFKGLNLVFTRDGKLPNQVLSKLVSLSTNQRSDSITRLEATSILNECKFALSEIMLFNLRKNLILRNVENNLDVLDLTKNTLDSTRNSSSAVHELGNPETNHDVFSMNDIESTVSARSYEDYKRLNETVYINHDLLPHEDSSEIETQGIQNQVIQSQQNIQSQSIQKIEDKSNKPLNKDDIILELIEKNQNNNEFTSFVRNQLSPQFDLVNSFYRSDSSLFPQNNLIQNWSESKIKKYATHIKQKPELLKDKNGFCELIAVISRLNFLQNGYTLRDVQVMSVLTILNANEKGRLLQIGTGEGKSTTTATIAAIKALQGQGVDVITSSSVLAKRDSEEWEKFFRSLDLTSAHNIDLDYIKGPKECYNSQIVYGDVSTFQADYLKQSHKDLGTRGSRNFETVIIDEVDSMLIDESSKLVKLSSLVPGSEYLSPIFIASWQELKKLDKQIIYLEAEKSYAFVPQNFSYNNNKLTVFDEGSKNQEIFILDDVDSFKEKHLVNYIQDIINQNAVLIPSYLKDQVFEQINDWASSAVKAQKLEIKKHYLIVRDNQGDEVIAPIDYLNTGNIQGNTVWELGLQQFLQVKHSLKVTAESNTTSFISNMGYFRKYGNKIYGLTGTLGQKSSQDLLKDIYSIDIAFIPNYKKRNFEELPPIVTDSDEDLIKNIIDSTIQQASKNKAVLILCETISDVEKIQEKIKKYASNFSKIVRYSRNDNEEIQTLREKAIPKQVIIATNLAGRGTDIKLSEKVINSGGLHVCLTFLPTNSRVEDQGFGRASRQGQSGSGQLIVNKSNVLKKLKLDPNAEVNSEQLKMIRDITQESHIKNIRENEVDRLTTNDDLFLSYSRLYHSLKSQENAPHKLRQVEELWGLKLKQIEKKYKASTQDNITKRQENFVIFENFSHQISDAYSSNTIMKNPAYLLLHGYNKMGSGGDYKESIKIMEDAAKLDDIYNFAVNYQLAYARLRQGFKEAAQKGKGTEKYIAYKNEVYENLANSKASIDQAIIPSLQALQINQDNADTPLLRQTQAKLQLYRLISSNITSAMRTIENGGEYEAMKINGPQKTLKDYFENKSSSVHKEIAELANFGMFTVYDVGFETLDSDARFNEIATFVLSAIQCVAGAALCATGSPWIGANLISEGISDLRSVAKGYSYSQNFSWDKYLEGKTITAATTIMTVGLEKAIVAAKAGKVIPLSKASQTLSKTSLELVAKQSAKEVIVKTIIRTSINIALSEVAELVAKKVINNSSADLIEKTREKLRSKFNSSPTLERLNQILSFDTVIGNTNRATLLQNSIAELAQTKRQLFARLSSSLSSSMMSSQNSVVSTIGVMSKTLEVANNANQVIELVEEFVSLIESKIATSKASLPTLVTTLKTKLSPNIQTDKDVNDLISILTNAGIYNDGEFVESKINYAAPNISISTTSESQNTQPKPLILRELSQTNIDTIDLGKFTPHRTRIKDVIHLIHKSKHHTDYSSRIEALVKFSASTLENGFNSKLRGGVVMQVANPLISSLSNVVVDGITKLGSTIGGSQGSSELYTSSGDEGIIDRTAENVRKLFSGKDKSRGDGVDNGDSISDAVEYLDTSEVISLSSEGGALRLMPQRRDTSVSGELKFISPVEPLNRLAIFKVNQGSNSYLGKTADLIIRQTSKLYDYVRDNPEAAKYIAYAPVAMRGIVGAIAGASGGPLTSIGGATSAVLSQEAYSYVVERALGSELSQLSDYAVNKVANFIRDTFDPSLSIEQATALSTAIIIGSMSAKSIKADTKAFVSALDRMSRSSVKIDIVRNSAFFFRGSESGSKTGDSGRIGGKLALGGGGKAPNTISLSKFEHFRKKDGSGRYECEKSQSPQWIDTTPFKDQFRTNGIKGKNREYYRWDHKHKDIEIYDSKARFLGSKDPVTGEIYRKGDAKLNKQLEGML